MDYPMPENMGFPLPRTISEMLPDEPLVEPERQRGRYGKDIHVSLIECACLTCGKIFESGPEYKYKTKDGRCCSYHCFRPFERADQEKFRKDTMGFVPECGGRMTPLEHARARVEKCKAKLEEYQAIRNDPQAWNAMPAVKRRSLASKNAKWKNELDEAKEMLKEAELYEP